FYDVNYQDPTKVYAGSQPWTLNFNGAVRRQVADMGYGFALPSANLWLKKHLLHAISDTAYNPYLVAMYYEGAWSGNQAGCSGPQPEGAPFMQTWAAMKDSYNSTAQGLASFSYSTTQAEWAYHLIALSAASFLPGLTDGALSGTTAYNWMKATVPDQILTTLVPRLRIVPRSYAAAPDASRCDLNRDSRIDVSDLQILINSTLGSACAADLNLDSRCDILDIQIEINSIISGICGAK
ncbi:MAG TPA: hypothetical protein VM120_22875, partial [Bryobacteraceae bacterium]|nr:hypothetical protein [Bryobacteraceae bacterium]